MSPLSGSSLLCETNVLLQESGQHSAGVLWGDNAPSCLLLMCPLAICMFRFYLEKKNFTPEIFMNEKRHKVSRKLPRGTPLSSPGYWLAVASPRSLGLLGTQCCPSSIEQGHWNGMTSTVWWGLSLTMVPRDIKRPRSYSKCLQLPSITPWSILGVS